MNNFRVCEDKSPIKIDEERTRNFQLKMVNNTVKFHFLSKFIKAEVKGFFTEDITSQEQREWERKQLQHSFRT